MMKMKTTLTALLIMEILELSSALSKQHFFVNDNKKWISARKHCRKYYNDLSTFTDASEEQQFLRDTTYQLSDAWVGLYRRDSDVWTWLGVQTAINISWDTDMNQPNNMDEHCGFLYKDHQKLHDRKCEKEQAFYCMTKSAVVPQGKSWNDALEYCRQNYDDLASLSSSNKLNLAWGIISQAQTQYVWTGLRFLAGEWAWISGDDFDVASSTNTLPECPAANLRCGALNKLTQIWMARDCEENLSFICQ